MWKKVLLSYVLGVAAAFGLGMYNTDWAWTTSFFIAWPAGIGLLPFAAMIVAEYTEARCERWRGSVGS